MYVALYPDPHERKQKFHDPLISKVLYLTKLYPVWDSMSKWCRMFRLFPFDDESIPRCLWSESPIVMFAAGSPILRSTDGWSCTQVCVTPTRSNRDIPYKNWPIPLNRIAREAKTVTLGTIKWPDDGDGNQVSLRMLCFSWNRAPYRTHLLKKILATQLVHVWHVQAILGRSRWSTLGESRAPSSCF